MFQTATDSLDRSVREIVADWIEDRNHQVRISDRGLDLLVQIIQNVRADPSPAWDHARIGHERLERNALEVLPAVLDAIARIGATAPDSGVRVITTWEILHRSETALRAWCPIPKKG